MAAYGIDYFIIYGHDTLDGTMFGSPDYYRQQDFWQTHSELNIYTGGERRTYQVFAVVKTRILNVDEDGFRYYNAVGDLSDGDIQTLIDWLKESAEYDIGITSDVDEQILMPSTCSNHIAQGRFVVAARLVARKILKIVNVEGGRLAGVFRVLMGQRDACRRPPSIVAYYGMFGCHLVSANHSRVSPSDSVT